MRVRLPCHLEQGNRIHQQQISRDDRWANLCRGAMFTLASIVLVGDLLDEIDNAAAQLFVLDACERLDQRKPIRSGDEFGDIVRRRSFTHAAAAAVKMRRALEEKRCRHLQDIGDLLQPAGADAVGALLVLLHLLESQTQRIAKLFLRLMRSIKRRIRTREPTCLSIGSGVFLIKNFPIDRHPPNDL